MKTRTILFAVVPLAILLLPLSVYWIDRAASEDEVPRNVSVAGVELGGLGRDDAVLAVQTHEAELVETPAFFIVNGKRYELAPKSVDLAVDETRLVNQAMVQRSEEGLISGFTAWIGGFTTPIVLDLPVSMDGDALANQLDIWETDAIPNPAYEGSVEVSQGEVLAEYPRAGEALDKDRASVLVFETLREVTRRDTELPVVTSNPELTDEDIDAAVEEVRRIIDNPVSLRSTDTGFLMTFETDQLEASVIVEVRDNPPGVNVSIDDQYIAAVLVPRRDEFEIPPVNAAYTIDLNTDRVEIIPGRSGTKLDLPGVVASLHNAALGGGFGEFPLLEGDKPEFTTDEAEEFFGDIELVSEFSTRYSAGQPRTRNIQLMADIVDGSIVLPGATWGINDHVGERTEEKGFEAAPAIIGGVVICCDHPANIGGGVSQFGTTFYNAVFFGCYEDVEHTPHSLYFTRYPEGREATLGFPKPDVIFRNNTDTPVIIKTQYTDRDITVKMFGNNGSKICTSETSERQNIEEHEEILVRDVPEEGERPLKPGQARLEQDGKIGFTVFVTRIVTMPDGTVIQEEPFFWRYRKLNEETAVHDCELSGEPVNCPAPLPNLVGHTSDEAFTTLTEAGYAVVRIDLVTEDPNQNEIVLDMNPPAGEEAVPGTTVTLTVGVFSGEDPGGEDPGGEDPGGGDPGDGGDDA